MAFDEKWLKEHYARMGMEIPQDVRDAAGMANEPGERRPRRKYRNTPTDRGGLHFDSIHEANVYDELMLRVMAGDLRGVVCQVPFRLPGGVIYKADFVTLKPDGTYDVLDAKSQATSQDKTYRLKARQMRECLGIVVKEV